MQDLGGIMIKNILQPTTLVNNNFKNPTQILDSWRASHNRKPTLKPHCRKHWHQT